MTNKETLLQAVAIMTENQCKDFMNFLDAQDESRSVSKNEDEKEFCDCGKIADYYYNGKNYCNNCIDKEVKA